MTAIDQREAKRRRDLARCTALLADLYRVRTPEEQEAAARALGREDLVPEAQATLPLASAA